MLNQKEKEQLNLKKLASLPYSSFVVDEENPKKSGVILKTKEACPGYNLYISGFSRKIYLLNLNGKIIHTWITPNKIGKWHYARLDKDGNLLIILSYKALYKLDKNSKVIWKLNGKFHHDLELKDNGEIISVIRKKELINLNGERKEILDECIALISKEGKIIKKISMYKLFKNNLTKELFERTLRAYKMDKRNKIRLLIKIPTIPDIFHLNTIRILKNNLNKTAKKGDLLVCLCFPNIIASINFEKEKISWYWKNGQKIIDGPHYPIQLANGNILVYDNGLEREWSRIIELNPKTERIAWSYGAEDKNNKEFFHSFWGGSCQELENGNILITDSEHGKVFEITKSGKKVWEFLNPKFNILKKRKTIYRMERYPLSILDSLNIKH